MQTAGQKRALPGEQRKEKAARSPSKRDAVSLAREAERLRAELDQERMRVKSLEDANELVSEKLDVAIKSMKFMLSKQG